MAGGGNPGVMGAGSLREVGEEGAGAGRKGEHFATLAQYFAIGKAHRDGNRSKGGGNREYRAREAGSSDPPPPPPYWLLPFRKCSPL